MTIDKEACCSAVRAIAVIAVTFVVAIVAAGWLDPRADAINKANSLLLESKYEEAIRLYENTVVENPDDLTGRLNSAIALYAAGKYEDSSARFNEVLSRLNAAESSHSKESSRLIETIARYGIGSAQYRLGLAAESLADTSAAVSRSTPSYGAAPAGQEALVAAMEHYRQAVSHFLDALILDPTDEDARHNYRLAYERLEELEKLLESTESSQQDSRQDGNESDEKQQGERSQHGDQDQQSDQSRQSDQSDSGDQDQQNDRSQQDTEAQESEQSDASGEQPEDLGGGVSESGDDGDTGDEEPQGVGVDQADKDRQPQMSLEEALRLLEMMESVEQHGVLVPLEGFADRGDYPNW